MLCFGDSMIKFPIKKDPLRPTQMEVLWDQLKHFLDSFRLNSKNDVLTLCEEPFIPVSERKENINDLISEDGSIQFWNIDKKCWETISHKMFPKICQWELFDEEFSEFYDQIPKSYHDEIKKMHDEHAVNYQPPQPEPKKVKESVLIEDVKKSLKIVEDTSTVLQIDKDEDEDEDDEEWNPFKSDFSKTSW